MIRALKGVVKRVVPRSRIDRILLTFPQLYPLVGYESQLRPEQQDILRRILAEDRPGNIIECGVYRAGTTVLMARMLQARGVRKTIYALDSYAGFEPEIEDEIKRGQVVAAGRSAFTINSVDYVSRKMQLLGVADMVRIVPGFFQDTLPGIDDRFCLALIDCDLEKSTEYCLTTLWPKIVDGGYVVVDDYQNPGYPGPPIAADRFFATVPHRSQKAGHNFLVVQK
jgi:predicted O-methyltransferase YrrM